MSQHSVIIEHIWYDGPQIAVWVNEDASWIPFGFSEIADKLDVYFSQFSENIHTKIFPKGRYLFFTESNQLNFVGGALPNEHS